jgi:hypothetical protein
MRKWFPVVLSKESIMNPELFFASLAVTLGVVLTALAYLRGATRRVILEFCESDAAAEFWLRSSDVLAISGALILVLTFGMNYEDIDWLRAMRLSIGLALAGLFVAVLFVSSSVWRNGIRVREAAMTSGPSEPSA